MTHRILLLALASLLFPSMVAAQGASSATGATGQVTRALPGADSLALAALAAIPAAAAHTDQGALPSRNRAWVRTTKWSLLVAAAGFGAYALANSRTEHTDRRAQVGLIGGQIALLGSVGLFIFDLRRDSPPPQNIPFEQPASGASATAVTTPVAPR